MRRPLFVEVRGSSSSPSLDGRRYATGHGGPVRARARGRVRRQSPTHIREVLRSLETDGYVRRIHGVGTFATERRPVVCSDLRCRSLGVTEAVEAADRALGVEIIRTDETGATGAIAERLALPPGTPALSVERVIRANGEPVAHAVDVIPGAVAALAESPYEGGSVYRFLEEACRLRLVGGVAEVTAVLADSHMARRLDVSPGSALLRTEQVERDADDRPVLLLTEHYVPARFTIHVRRVRRSRLG